MELGLTNAGFSRGLQSGAARVAILPTGINCVFVASGFLSTNAYGGTNKRIDPVAAAWSWYADYRRCAFGYSLQVQRLKSAKRDRAQYSGGRRCRRHDSSGQTPFLRPVTSLIRLITSQIVHITPYLRPITSLIRLITSQIVHITPYIKPITSLLRPVTSLLKPVTSLLIWAAPPARVPPVHADQPAASGPAVP